MKIKGIFSLIIVLTVLFNAMQIPLGTTVQAADNIKVVTSEAGDLSPGSVRQVASTAVAGDIIVFADNVNYITLEGEIYTNLSNITYDASLDENGLPRGDNRMVTIDANGASRAINNNPKSSSTTLVNLIIKNGNSTAQGGGVRIGSNGSLINCRFINNTSTSTGGGVWALDNLDVTDCYFYGNSATSGGGLHSQKVIKIYNSSFINNSATSDAENAGGGAVYGSNSYGIFVVNSTFAENDSAGVNQNGTIFTGSNNASAYIALSQSTVVNNGSIGMKVQASGQANCLIYNSLLAGNNGNITSGTAADQHNASNPRGVNIIEDGTTHIYSDIMGANPTVTYLVDGVEISGSVATDSEKESASTAYCIPNRAYPPNTTALRLTQRPNNNSNFPADYATVLATYDQLHKPRTNQTTISFGAIDFLRKEIMVTTPDDDGSPGSLREVIAAASDYDVITFDPAVFNSALNNRVYLNTPIILTKSIRIIGNMYDTEFDYSNKRLTVDGKKGTAIDGGEISSLFISQIGTDATVVLENLSFENATGTSGSALTATDGTFQITNCIFNKNISSENGGAIAVGNLTADAYMNFYNCVFSWNTAINGGAIYVNNTSNFKSNISLLNCYATQNKATTGTGSVFYSLGGIFRAVNTTFYENICDDTALATRAAVYTHETNGTTIYLYHCSFVKNTAGTYTNYGNISALRTYNCLFVENGNNTVGAGGHARHLGQSGYTLRLPSVAEVYGADAVPNDTKLIPLADGPANTVGAFSLDIAGVDVLPAWLPTVANAVKFDQCGKERASGKYVTYGAVDVDYVSSVRYVTNANESGEGSLSYVVEQALPYDIIRFNSDVKTIPVTSEIHFKKALYFEGNVDADGNPETTLDAGQTGRIFRLEDNNAGTTFYSDTTFKNLRFINGRKTGTNDVGGAVQAQNSGSSSTGPLRSLEFENCHFKDNTLTGTSSKGGAVYSLNNTRFIRCLFENNSAATGGAVGCGNRGTTISIGSVFKGNKSTGTAATNIGSAVSSERTVIAVNSTFTENVNTSAAARGGVIANANNSSAPLMLYHCTVVNNNQAGKSENIGAPVSTQNSSKLTMYNNIILNNGANTAVTDGTLDTAAGQINLTGTGTTGYIEAFGTNVLAPEGYILPLYNEETNLAAPFTATPHAMTPDLFDILAYDQLGYKRSAATPFFGAVDGNALQFKDGDGGFAVDLSEVLEDDTLFVEKYIRNTFEDEQTYTLIAALYAAEGELTQVATSTSDTIDADKLTALTVELDVSERTDDSYVIVYLWNGLSAVKPLESPIKFK